MSIQALRDQRNKIAVALNKLVADQKDSAWNDEHQIKYDGMVSEIESIDNNLDRQQKVLDLGAKHSLSNRQRSEHEGISEDEAEHLNNQSRSAYANFLRGGMEALNDEQRTALSNRLRNPNNTMSTTTGSQGGYLTENEVAPEIAKALKEFGGMRQIARVVNTETGSTIPWPTADSTSVMGEWLAQNAGASGADPVFGTRNIDTHKLSSKVIAVPFELLQDNLFDIESYVNEQIVERIGRTSEAAYINGSGTGQPHGLLADITAGKVGLTGQTASLIFDDLIDIEHSVDPAYRKSPSAGYMFADTTLKGIRKLKDTTGRPIWLPGLSAADPDTINNYQYVINQHMPVMAANAKSLAFGDFSKYIIRDVMSMMTFRFTDSAYTKLGQVGFLAMMRTGGRYIDVGGAIKYFQNSAT
jgi:HK97 family phage major capsid protein